MLRRYRGKDIWHWIERLGDLEQTIDEMPDRDAARRALSFGLSGRNGGENLDLSRLNALGITVTGRLEGWDGATARFSDNLEIDIADSELRLHRLLERIDDHIDTQPNGASSVPAREPVPPVPLPAPPSALDLGGERITSPSI
jgi:putative flavoprotein involved in K+ transport